MSWCQMYRHRRHDDLAGVLYDLAFIPRIDDRLVDLSRIAEPEEWAYQHTPSDHPRPILHNFLVHTYKRLTDEDKIVVSEDGQSITFNTE